MARAEEARAVGFFACRHCHGLAYACQAETPTLRSIRRARKMRMRLGAGFSFAEPIREKTSRHALAHLSADASRCRSSGRCIGGHDHENFHHRWDSRLISGASRRYWGCPGELKASPNIRRSTITTNGTWFIFKTGWKVTPVGMAEVHVQLNGSDGVIVAFRGGSNR
jgi:hypothetical protein